MARVLLTGAVWGPIIFIACWFVGGLIEPGYSPIAEPISRLAAIGADTRTLMNVGLAAFAIGVGGASWPLQRRLGPAAAATLGVNALMTVGVMAAPLDRSPMVDTLHTVFAGVSYTALAAASLFAARYLRSRWWLLVGVVTATALTISTLDIAPGLFQRIGLTTTDLALIGTGLGLSGRRGVGVSPPRPGSSGRG